MRNSYPAGGFGGRNIDGMWQAMEELRSRFEKRVGHPRGPGRSAGGGAGPARGAADARLPDHP